MFPSTISISIDIPPLTATIAATLENDSKQKCSVTVYN